MKSHRLPLMLLAVVALAAGSTVGWLLQGDRLGDREPLALQAGTSLLGHARALPAFTLVDHNGNPFDNDRLTGKWTFIFFGYTHCPDICPTTLSTLAQVAQQLENDDVSKDTQFVFVSVDPDRDTPQTLAGYVVYFNPDFIGVTGDEQALAQLTSSLGILYAKVEDPSNPENYLVDHSGSILLVGPGGELAAVFSAPHDPALLATDLRSLYKAYGSY